MRSKIFLIISLISSIFSHFKIDPTRRFILDPHGRYSIFHGVNAVFKLPPYLPNDTSFSKMSLTTDEDISNLKRLGFNFVRLGVIWESVEKAPNFYDQNYLNEIEKIVNKLGKNGIYTMIDAHQDLFSRNICGEGVPHFYVEDIGMDRKCDASLIAYFLGFLGICKPFSSYGYRVDSKGLPLIKDCKTRSFGEYHVVPEFSSLYRDFYDNKNGIQDKFAKFWKNVDSKFRENKYVLGYDFWNEPAPGGHYKNLLNVIPGKGDNDDLIPLYKKVDAEINNPDYIMFFENMPIPDCIPILGGIFLGSFKTTPLPQNRKQVFNIHNYCCVLIGGTCDKGEPNYETATTKCRAFHDKKFKNDKKIAHEILNVPLINTEFGACSDTLACYEEMMNVLRNCEKNFVGWAYWNYKPYGDHTTSAIEVVEREGIYNEDLSVQRVKERALSRSYMQYYQGRPVKFEFEKDSETNFESIFLYERDVKEPSVLYFNKKFFYRKGKEILEVFDEKGEDLIKSGKVKINVKEENYIEILVVESAVEDGKEIRVKFGLKEN